MVFLKIFIYLSLAFSANAQNEGCLFLEGLELPCFGGGVACGGCSDKYTEDEMNNACAGTLPVGNPAGCSFQGSCGRKCCKSCSDYDPADYLTCRNLPSACDADGNTVSVPELLPVTRSNGDLPRRQLPGLFHAQAGLKVANQFTFRSIVRNVIAGIDAADAAARR